MATRTRIEPVPPAGEAEAISFLASGRRRDPAARSQAAAYENLLQTEGRDSVLLWWARRWGRCAAAAMILAHPGRTGALFHSPIAAPGVHRAALAEVIAAVSRAALDERLAFVQALAAPEDRKDAEMLRAAGYEFLAELVYMQRDLMSEPPGEAPVGREPARVPADGADECGLTWRAYGEFDEAELGNVIEATYVDSRDCPSLMGVRQVADVIRGHKSSGVFRADSWWLVDVAGSPAGCILVNDSRCANTSEVVYLGVVPAYRGRGLCGRMLRRAACAARDRGRTQLKLAVDSDNIYAMQVYDSEWFVETARRHVHLAIRRNRRCGSRVADGL